MGVCGLCSALEWRILLIQLKPSKPPPPRTAHIAIKVCMEALPNFRIMLELQKSKTWAGEGTRVQKQKYKLFPPKSSKD